MRIFRSIFRPEMFHGHNKNPPFFEGWYYKLISADESHKYAIIPGVFLGKDGYAFVQVLQGNTGEVEFIKYPLETFSAAKDDFVVKIGENTFQLNSLHLDIRSRKLNVYGKLEFENVIGWPITLTSPGVMGWYAWVPKMECYHGVLGFDHRIIGSLEINGVALDFTDGRGYIEKDWGAAFPEGYVWMQTNHFQRPNVCLTASIAMIPWLGSAFRGFIAGLWIDGELFRFTTYAGAQVDLLEVGDSKVLWKMRDKNFRLEIEAWRGITGDLKGPTRRNMGMRVAESLAAKIHVKLMRTNGEIIFEDTGLHAGLEVAGDIERLLNTE
ncbi:MAG: hypothetical protein JW757_06345 [Anaerolineales bacterium]|nr:hypothetical protein [Anaerolineales bacterium]